MNKTINYRGRKFYQDEGQPYYRAWSAALGRPEYLHRVIWADKNGPIPPGFDVHHLDEDPENNEPYNLEALSRQDHKLLHWEALSEAQQDRIRANLIERANPAATRWHRSPEGRQWHREKAARELPGRAHLLACEACGVEVRRQGVIQRGRFCSDACKAAHRRASGVDNHERGCVFCGESFTANRYSKTRTCGRACANRMRKRG